MLETILLWRGIVIRFWIYHTVSVMQYSIVYILWRVSNLPDTVLYIENIIFSMIYWQIKFVWLTSIVVVVFKCSDILLHSSNLTEYHMSYIHPASPSSTLALNSNFAPRPLPLSIPTFAFWLWLKDASLYSLESPIFPYPSQVYILSVTLCVSKKKINWFVPKIIAFVRGG